MSEERTAGNDAPAYSVPRSVADTWCPEDHPLTEAPERRYLWWLENSLAVSATTETLRQMRLDLYRYLCATCDHHWHDDPTGYGGIRPPYRQCLWCNTVEDLADARDIPPAETEWDKCGQCLQFLNRGRHPSGSRCEHA